MSPPPFQLKAAIFHHGRDEQLPALLRVRLVAPVLLALGYLLYTMCSYTIVTHRLLGSAGLRSPHLK